MNIDSFELIDLVKNCPQIYDSSTNDFKIPERKDRAWQNIAQALHASDAQCRKRWRTLRERYTREIKRMKKMEATDSNEPSGPVWCFFNQMSFLSDYVKLRKTRYLDRTQDDSMDATVWTNKLVKSDPDKLILQSTEFNQIEIVEETNNLEAIEESYLVENDDHSLNSCSPKPPISNFSADRLPKRCKRQYSIDETNEKSGPQQTNNSEDDLFCRAVACSLKKLSRIHNVKAKVEIYKVLEKFIELEEQKDLGKNDQF